MLELKKSEKIKIKIYGEELEVSKPTFGQVVKMQKDMKEKGTEENFSIMKDLLIALGVNESVVNELEIEHINDLIIYLTSSKKN